MTTGTTASETTETDPTETDPTETDPTETDPTETDPTETGRTTGDPTTALAELGQHVSPGTGAAADAVIAAGPAAVFARLVRDQESETVLLLARRVLGGALLPTGPPDVADDHATSQDPHGLRGRQNPCEVDADPAALIDAACRDLHPVVARLAAEDRTAVLRERAPVALTDGCWLDTVSQPATQPALVVNTLFGHYVAMRGHGNPRRGVHHLRRAALEDAGVHLPDVAAPGFAAATGARPLSLLLAAHGPALSRLPASFLPELVGVHVATGLLGIDDRLLGTEPVPGEQALRAVLDEYLDLTRAHPDGAAHRARLVAGVRAACDRERTHVAMLEELVAHRAGRTLTEQVADVVARHAPFAGTQHKMVRVGDRKLADALSDPDLDVAAFLGELHASRSLRPARDGGDCRFLRAIRFGGSMFGIFDEAEAAVFRQWATTPADELTDQATVRPDVVGDEEYRARAAHLDRTPPDVTEAAPRDWDDRELFWRMVTVENHPHVLDTARALAARGLDDGEVMFTHGARGRYTDASWFDYSPDALRERTETIYWDKLVGPYRPLTEIPDRDEVVFVQKTFALGSLVDGAWAHRIGNLPHYERDVDARMFFIYADEMGLGDVRKNHITLIEQVLSSMDVHLPHIRERAFVDQDEIPDITYGFALNQSALALFPDTYYDEILGYNLGIEMFGLGEMRSHEIQKLQRHGFDIAYEQAHLSIDNISAGHARQAADIIVDHLDEVARADPAAVAPRWRRVWRGYASFAWFVETTLRKELAAAPAPAEQAELTI